ncbi:MAG: site-2 protease family protein [Chloroflexi bacterium]|nr:MAG: site-2 protease family protein [Chloroflexota bacterium]TMB94356.1 MAG: site-2 protease family protein [Chloroflexota bacterium]TMC26143.1 MAG: site-2 protease family protein [Chloroflexota bacterium]TMC33485.1 MAG: site-2 protease family protein [Chloroflexota bacterium]TMC54995.1 MAG: site-2 protease family protein [Chloroflexota bacterium]
MIGARRGGIGPGGLDPMLLFGLAILVYAFLRGTLVSPVQRASQDPIGFVAFIIAIVLGITVHEFMHAYAAHRLGDDTARVLGRLTLNPMAHLDPFGTLLLVLAGFGYGKPVPFNESRLRSALGVTFVALAGPLANIALAAVAALPLRFGSAEVFGDAYAEILGAIVLWNCVLAIFNLVPIPPLDGANVVYGLLPPRQQFSWRTYQQYGPFLLLAVLLFAPQILSAVVFAPALAIVRFLIG